MKALIRFCFWCKWFFLICALVWAAFAAFSDTKHLTSALFNFVACLFFHVQHSLYSKGIK